MGRGEVEGVAEDGGWGELIDHGHDLAEYMLDTPHPYDLHSHKPADRWGTRQQLVSQRFADPGSLADEGRPQASGPASSSGRSRPTHQEAGGRPSKPTPVTSSALASRQPVTPHLPRNPKRLEAATTSTSLATNGTELEVMALLGGSPSPKASKARKLRRRSEVVAGELSVRAEVVAGIVRSPLGTSEIAAALGIPVDLVTSIKRAYRRVCNEETNAQIRAQRSPKPPPTRGAKAVTSTASRSRHAKRKAPRRLLQPLNPMPGCMACGAAIGPNGRCQCS